MSLRLTAMLALMRELSVPALVLTWIVVAGFGRVDSTDTERVVNRLAPALMAAVYVDPVGQADVPRIAERSIADLPIVIDAATASQEPPPVVTAALSSSSEAPPVEPSVDLQISMATPESDETSRSAIASRGIEECVAEDQCIDRYLWALYLKTPKEDAIKVLERRTVTIRKKGKQVSVARTFTKLVDEDFSWKDPNAAEKAGKPIDDYVIGGMDREFKSRLFSLLLAAEAAGFSPGITSAFRDDYRQSIATGLKAATDRSYHGGSLRGGYGHGLAADIVSVNGATRAQRMASSQSFWSWIDGHGKEFGIGRPYLNKDPPHVGPIDGKEYADHRPAPKTQQTIAVTKPGNKTASPSSNGSPQQAKTAKSIKVGTMRPA